MISIRSRAFDILGACASGLCLIHCIATPFLFVAQTGLHKVHERSQGGTGMVGIY
jgi:hypothetical protein